jgi:hypothetical protein
MFIAAISAPFAMIQSSCLQLRAPAILAHFGAPPAV